MSDDKYDFIRPGIQAKRVGQAVHDIITKEQPNYTVEDILDGANDKFRSELEKCIEDHQSNYNGPFYIFVLTNKEFWAENVVRNWFIPRKTPPYALDMMTQYPHHVKTLYLVDARRGNIKICWSLPGYEDCKSILKDPLAFDAQLVQWIKDCMEGKLEKDAYSFDDLLLFE